MINLWRHTLLCSQPGILIRTGTFSLTTLKTHTHIYRCTDWNNVFIVRDSWQRRQHLFALQHILELFVLIFSTHSQPGQPLHMQLFSCYIYMRIHELSHAIKAAVCQLRGILFQPGQDSICIRQYIYTQSIAEISIVIMLSQTFKP